MVLFLDPQTSMIAPIEAERTVIDLTVPAPCPEPNDTGFDDEILVCAKRGGESPPGISGAQIPDAQGLARAEVQLSDNSTLSAETESADLGMARSQRLMVRWKLKF